MIFFLLHTFERLTTLVVFFSAISVVIVNHYDFSVISSKLLYKLVCFWYPSLESWLYQKYINNLRWTFTLQICTTLRWTFHHWTILVRNVPGSCISFDINLCQLQRFSGIVLRSSSSMVTFPFWRPSKPSHASDWEMEMYRSVSIDCVPITLKDKIEYFQKKNDHLGCWQLFRGSCTFVVRFLLPKIDRKMAGTDTGWTVAIADERSSTQNLCTASL